MKAHLKSSPEPLLRGTDIVAACSRVIPRADFVMEFDQGTDEIKRSRTTLQFCPDCLEAICWSRYTYALAPGEEVKQLDAA